MNVTSPLLKGVSQVVAMPGDSVTSLLKTFGEFTGLYGDDPDGPLGLVRSGLAGAATALAIAIAFTLYFHSKHRTTRDVLKHSFAAVVVLALVAFAASDVRHAALDYLGINPSKPAVEFEIRLPKAALSTIPDTQIELHTDRNQQLAQVEGAQDGAGDLSVLRGFVTLDYRTTNRVVVLNLPGHAQCEFKLRLAADPSPSGGFGPWHLADRIALPGASEPNAASPQDAFAIRYRVL
jgi:hypothetical protein